MGEPRSNQRGSTRPVQPRESSRSRSPPGRNYVTSKEDIDDSMIVKPKTMDQACWLWERNTDDSYHKCFYWYNDPMSPRALLMHRPPCPGRAASPPRSSPSPTHPRTKLAPSSARIAEPLDPDVEITAKPAPPRPPPAPSVRPDAYSIAPRRTGHTPSPEGRWNADTTAENALKLPRSQGNHVPLTWLKVVNVW